MSKSEIAAEVLALNELWDKTDKSVIADNVEKFLYAKHPECQTSFKAKMERLMEYSGSQKQTVYAWVNRSRGNVKVPFLKLCMIANALDVDIKELLNAN